MNINRVLHISQRLQTLIAVQHRGLQVINRGNVAFTVTKVQDSYLLRRFKSTYPPDTINTSIKVDSFIQKFLKSLPFVGINKSKLKAVAFLQYETMADQINFIEFVDELDLPDTFYTWFVIIELHMWMISARAMAEGDDGRFIRNNMVEALWADVFQRVKKLGVRGNPVDTRAKIVELSEQLQATFIAYDEGLQGDDIVLAGALWRRFYQQGDADLEHVEILVKYIRRNMRMLESLGREQFFDAKNIKWKSLMN